MKVRKERKKNQERKKKKKKKRGVTRIVNDSNGDMYRNILYNCMNYWCV